MIKNFIISIVLSFIIIILLNLFINFNLILIFVILFCFIFLFINFYNNKFIMKFLKDNWKDIFRNFIFFMRKLNFIWTIFTFLIFFFGWLSLYLNIENSNFRLNLLYSILFSILIYIIFLRWIKLKYTTNKDNNENKFFYKNITILILNLSIFVSLILYSIPLIEDVPDNIKIYIYLKKLTETEIFLYMIFFLIFLNFFLLYLNYKNIEKDEENQVKNIYEKKMEEVWNNTFVIKYLHIYFQKYLDIFKKILIFYFYFNMFFLMLNWIVNFEILNNIIFFIVIYLFYLFLFFFFIYLIIFFFYFYVFLKSSYYGIVWNPDPVETTTNIKRNLMKFSKNSRLNYFWLGLSIAVTGYTTYRLGFEKLYPNLEHPEDKHIRYGIKKIFDFPSDELIEKTGEYKELYQLNEKENKD